MPTTVERTPSGVTVFKDRTSDAQSWARRAAETHKNTIFRSKPSHARWRCFRAIRSRGCKRAQEHQ